MNDLDLPDFDPRTTRKAVRRGLLKTASIVLAGLVALALVLVVAPIMFQKAGGRADRMENVFGTAFKIYNPAYRIVDEECCEVTPWAMSMTVRASQIRAYGGFSGSAAVPYSITQNLFGTLGHLPLGNEGNTTLTTALSMVGHKGPVDKAKTRELLDGLPKRLRALATVEFTAPLTAEQLVAFGRRYNACPERIVYEARPGSVPITFEAGMWSRSNVMPKSGMCHDVTPTANLAEFRAWDKILQNSDASMLRDFDLTLERVRKAAKDGLAHAYIDTGARIDELRKLLDDPQVRAVRLVDATFDLARF
ncbi:hypothetical protein ACIBEJ_15855 [Nonomuraea sp. NPDC050790]|uniref:hypothetical protein n=1 Tax=Nonomuraea sp. NPDC050790 TaxID=3364371 RepID=UPI0037883889